jgi:hypothetical protein
MASLVSARVFEEYDRAGNIQDSQSNYLTNGNNTERKSLKQPGISELLSGKLFMDQEIFCG